MSSGDFHAVLRSSTQDVRTDRVLAIAVSVSQPLDVMYALDSAVTVAGPTSVLTLPLPTGFMPPYLSAHPHKRSTHYSTPARPTSGSTIPRLVRRSLNGTRARVRRP